ncbi:MAG TPA: DUF3164 family protein [Candidatus Limiplasma sp.]|nr:DUF3164 family protein [Candidatus Limiplasma sp.]
MSEINIENLSPGDRQRLLGELRQADKAEKQRRAEERKAYKELVDETVPVLMTELMDVSVQLMRVKRRIFADTERLVDLKNSIYGVRTDQQSHSFTSTSGEFTITVGYRINDGWDDTVWIGVKMIRQFIEGMATDKASKQLILKLLKPDKKGLLKANRVLELVAIVEEIGDDQLSEGMKIVQEAYRPMQSVSYIEASFRDVNGKVHNVPLGVSAIDAMDPVSWMPRFETGKVMAP